MTAEEVRARIRAAGKAVDEANEAIQRHVLEIARERVPGCSVRLILVRGGVEVDGDDDWFEIAGVAPEPPDDVLQDVYDELNDLACDLIPMFDLAGVEEIVLR